MHRKSLPTSKRGWGCLLTQASGALKGRGSFPMAGSWAGTRMPQLGSHKQAKPHAEDAGSLRNRVPSSDPRKTLSPRNRSLVPRSFGAASLGHLAPHPTRSFRGSWAAGSLKRGRPGNGLSEKGAGHFPDGPPGEKREASAGQAMLASLPASFLLGWAGRPLPSSSAPRGSLPELWRRFLRCKRWANAFRSD